VNLDSAGMERDYFDLFDQLYRTFNSENTRILLSPSWAQAVTESFLARTKETADRLGKVPIHMHCLQTPIQKAFSLRRYGQTAVAWLDERGLIDEHVALGHAIWVTDRDIDILARTARLDHQPPKLQPGHAQRFGARVRDGPAWRQRGHGPGRQDHQR